MELANHHFTLSPGEPHHSVAVPVIQYVRLQSLTRAVETLRPAPVPKAAIPPTRERCRHANHSVICLSGRIFSERALLNVRHAAPGSTIRQIDLDTMEFAIENCLNHYHDGICTADHI
jgi:hypothetical protein